MLDRQIGEAGRSRNQTPFVIQSSPFSASFRQELARPINGKSILEVMKEEGVSFYERFLEWDGVNRAGERKIVTLVPTIRDQGMVDTVQIGLSDIDDQGYRLPGGFVALSVNAAIKDFFIGEGEYHFLNYFQTICKAVEDGMAMTQIQQALQRAKLEIPQSASRRWLLTSTGRSYPIEFYESFVSNLSDLRYLAY